MLQVNDNVVRRMFMFPGLCLCCLMILLSCQVHVYVAEQWLCCLPLVYALGPKWHPRWSKMKLHTRWSHGENKLRTCMHEKPVFWISGFWADNPMWDLPDAAHNRATFGVGLRCPQHYIFLATLPYVSPCELCYLRAFPWTRANPLHGTHRIVLLLTCALKWHSTCRPGICAILQIMKKISDVTLTSALTPRLCVWYFLFTQFHTDVSTLHTCTVRSAS
jgi:hypothetical protein